MDITTQDVLQLANLARLELTEAEAESLKGDLTAMLDYVDKLSEVDCTGIEPTTHAVPLVMRLREDEPTVPLTRDEVVANAPDSDDGMFRVPRVVND